MCRYLHYQWKGEGLFRNLSKNVTFNNLSIVIQYYQSKLGEGGGAGGGTGFVSVLPVGILG